MQEAQQTPQSLQQPRVSEVLFAQMGEGKHTDPLHRQKAYRTIQPTTGKLVLPLVLGGHWRKKGLQAPCRLGTISAGQNFKHLRL